MDRSTASDQLFTILESEFIQRDRGIHPRRSRRLQDECVAEPPHSALVLAELALRGHGADLPAGRTRPLDHDLILNYAKDGEPIGERTIIHGACSTRTGAACRTPSSRSGRRMRAGAIAT